MPCVTSRRVCGERQTLVSLEAVCSHLRFVQRNSSVGPWRNSSEELRRARKQGMSGIGSSRVLQYRQHAPPALTHYILPITRQHRERTHPTTRTGEEGGKTEAEQDEKQPEPEEGGQH